MNKKEAYAVKRAEKHNINYKIIESKNKKREDFDHEMLEVLAKNKIEIVVLAGFMRILSKPFITKYKKKEIDICNKFV